MAKPKIIKPAPSVIRSGSIPFFIPNPKKDIPINILNMGPNNDALGDDE